MSPLRLLSFSSDGPAGPGPIPSGPGSAQTAQTAQTALAAWRSAGASLWLDAAAPSPAELAALDTALDLEPSPAFSGPAVGTAARPRPRLVRHGAYNLLRLYVPHPGALSGDPSVAGVPSVAGGPGVAGGTVVAPGGLTPLDPLLIYAGQRFLLTVHDRPLPFLDGVAARARAAPAASGGLGGPPSTVALLHDLLIALLDAYGDVLDHLAETAESREEATYGTGRAAQRAQRDLDRIRRDLFALRRLATAQRSALALLTRGRSLVPGAGGDEPRFEDVLDRAVRLEQAIAVQYGLLVSARAAHRSWIAAGVTRVTRTLLVVTCLLAAPTLVVSVYGMNFGDIPELASPLGHLWAVAVALGLDGALWLSFRRRGWV